MKSYVTDTMALVLFIEKRRMPASVKSIFEAAETATAQILVPAMLLAEIGYLSEPGRTTCNLAEVAKICASPKAFNTQPLDLEIGRSAFQIPDTPELHDRPIAATAAHLGLPLLTNDPVIGLSTSVSTLWD